MSDVVCGIAGYSLSDESAVDQTLATQTLLAAISERGSDAVGYAYRGRDVSIAVHKQRGGASAFLDQLAVPAGRAAGARPRARLHEGPPQPDGQQPSDPARVGRRHPQRHHRERRGDPRLARLRARRARDDRGLRGHLRAGRGGVQPADGRSRSCTARWPPPGWTSGSRTSSISHAASAARSGSARASRRLFFASTHQALELVERYTDAAAPQARAAARGRSSPSSTGASPDSDSFEPDRTFVRGIAPPAREGARGGTVVPRPPGGDHRCRRRALGLSSTPLCSRRAPSAARKLVHPPRPPAKSR